jgi:hypothetical protein
MAQSIYELQLAAQEEPEQPPSPSSQPPHTPSSVAFGISREQNSRRFFRGYEHADPHVPGPGAYNPSRPIGLDSKKFSFSPRCRDPTKQPTPGPGAYDPRTQLNRTGNYFLSRNSGACIFAPVSSHRFQCRGQNQRPGPGVYEPKLGMNTTGHYFFSQFRSTQASTFSKSPRVSERKSLQTPGPGAYRLPSAFETRRNRHLL